MIRIGTTNRTQLRVLACLLLTLGTGLVTAQEGPVFPTKKNRGPNPQEPEFPPPGTQPKSSGPTRDKIDPIDVDDLPSQATPAFDPQEPATDGLDIKVFSPPKPPLADDALDPIPDVALPEPNAGTRPGSSSFNFGVAVSELFLNELASDARQEADAVCDRILGAQVSGTQQTTATTRVDCRRNNQTAQINFVLQSITNSSTIGRLPNASVSTEGYHRADLVKPVFFDGRTLKTKRPEGFIKANNMTLGVMTPLSGTPFLGPIANQIAQARTAQSRTASETETANSLARKVVPRFNQSVDERLADANRRLRSEVEPWLRDRDLWPADMRCTTTDSELRYRARYGNQSPPQPPNRRLYGKTGSVLIHETAANSLVSRLSLAGMRITDRQLQRTLASLSGNSTEAPEVAGEESVPEDLSEPMLYTLIFADDRPITIRFRDGAIVVNLRLSIEAAVSTTSIPTQEIQLAITPRTETGKVILDFAPPRVRQLDGADDTASDLIRQQIARLIKPVELPGTRELSMSPTKRVAVRFSNFATSNGWFLIALD